jgi:hypothetical protein
MMDISNGEVVGTLAQAMVQECKDRASVLSVMSMLDATMECCRRTRTADGLRNGPMAKSGARSHRVWREHLAEQLASPPLLAVIMALGVQAAAGYADVARGEE